jgi:hypothetical protein
MSAARGSRTRAGAAGGPLARHRARLARGEEGLALVIVLLTMMVMILLVTAALAYVVGGQNLSGRDQNRVTALSAAQAGVNDFLYRLQRDPGYATDQSTGPPNPALTGWASLRGPRSSAFHYSVTTPLLASQGLITLTSSGRAGGVTRTLRVDLRRRTFLQYSYFTDFEAEDPASGSYSNPTSAEQDCSIYWWQGRSTSSCRRVYFATGDVVNGPVHTNDELQIYGSPVFNAAVTTSSTTLRCSSGVRWNGFSGKCTETPTFQSGDPKYAPTLGLPRGNTELSALAAAGGCQYSGATRIVLRDDGSMDVTSPSTPFTAACGGGPGTTNVRAPTVENGRNGVLYVRSASSPAACAAGQNELAYPISRDVTTYRCGDGDVFLSGRLNGQLTIAAEHDVVIVGDTTYSTSGRTQDHMLGLIPNGSVKIYHPVDSSGANLRDRTDDHPKQTFTDPVLQAAILALNRSFIVQNHSKGAALGRLTFTGSIAARWRGPVGLDEADGSSHGYVKQYDYDTRLATKQPPNFLQPESAWTGVTTAEIRNPTLPP